MTPPFRFVLVFDTETTGLLLHPSVPIAKQPRCIEWAGIVLSGESGEPVREFTTLLQPGVALDADITKITGLTDADLVGAPTWAEALPRIEEFCVDVDRVIAHNFPFDRDIVKYEMDRLCPPDAPVAPRSAPWPTTAQPLCTVGANLPAWGRRMKLTELYLHVMERPLAQTHRALDDVRALVDIVRAQQLWKP